MTLTTEVVADLHAADGALADLDADSDVGFFSMSSASAEQVTVQIRTVLDRGWQYIALAYTGRAFVALGYPTWDAYVDARFGDFRIAVAGTSPAGRRRPGRRSDVNPGDRQPARRRRRHGAPRNGFPVRSSGWNT
jgi:hypothetical protein